MTSPLWPIPIPILGLTGEYASGKTLFALTIDPKNTVCFDEEKSSASYTSLGFDRRDIFLQVGLTCPNFRPIDVYLWWLDSVDALPANKFRVMVLDTVGTIEQGLCDWVAAHPEYFGKTKGQYQSMQGLFWGDVKSHWKFILNKVADKVETFAFTSHMAAAYVGNKPSGKRKPKGKETLMELASLYLQMERLPDSSGAIPAKPSAIVRKSRLVTPHIVNGELEMIPSLPPRIPVCTPATIRQYMLTPPDYSNLKTEELAPETGLSDDEKLQIAAETAAAIRDTELAKLEQQRISGPPIQFVQRSMIESLAEQLNLTPQQLSGGIAAYIPGKSSVAELTGLEADTIIAKLEAKLQA